MSDPSFSYFVKTLLVLVAVLVGNVVAMATGILASVCWCWTQRCYREQWGGIRRLGLVGATHRASARSALRLFRPSQDRVVTRSTNASASQRTAKRCRTLSKIVLAGSLRQVVQEPTSPIPGRARVHVDIAREHNAVAQGAVGGL